MRFGSRHSKVPAALIAALLLTTFHGCQAPPGEGVDTSAENSRTNNSTGGSNVAVHYLEIVSNDTEALCATYERVHALSFGPEDPEIGMARVAVRPDGSFVGIRKPLAEHEKPTMRAYVAVTDIEDAVAKAEEAGAVIAYPPTRHGEWGTYAIYIHGDVEHGLWQR